MRRSARQPVQPKGAALTGLAVQGRCCCLSIRRKNRPRIPRQAAKNAAVSWKPPKHGDEDAIETLTIEDIDLYSMVSRRIAHEDVYSIIETCFMPLRHRVRPVLRHRGNHGKSSTSANRITKEEIYNLKLDCNDMVFHVAINKQDLLGEPRIGRRFKGQVWMQGTVLF